MIDFLTGSIMFFGILSLTTIGVRLPLQPHDRKGRFTGIHKLNITTESIEWVRGPDRI